MAVPDFDGLIKINLAECRPIEFVGESLLVKTPVDVSVQVKIPQDGSYTSVTELACTTHRLHFWLGSDLIAIRLDSVSRTDVRGGLLRSPKIVIEMLGNAKPEVSIRISHKGHFDALLSAVNSALQGQAWKRTDGFIPVGRLGGVSRVVARIDRSVHQRGVEIDRGLSDLQSLRSNAKQLKETISNLKRDGSDPEVSEINALLSEFGLFSSTEASAAASESGIAALVQSALSAASGVMLVHDLFCLINRKVQVERILLPKEFLAELVRIPSIQLMDVCGYKVAVSFKLADVNSKTMELLTASGPQSEAAIASKLRIGNLNVFHLLLLKAEESFGTLVRDEHDQVTWYVNTLIS